MKKIMLILSVIAVFICSCSKEDNKVKQVRLKTYTHEYYERTPAKLHKYTIEYNSANKISKVIVTENGNLYQILTCVYTSSNILDSIVERDASGIMTYYYKIGWNGNKITSTNNIQLTYNSDGFLDRKTYGDGSYFRNVYGSDSIKLYYKDVSAPEVLRATYKISTTIKNPFLIAGFEKEAYTIGILFYYYNAMNALLPFIEIAEVGNKNYTFEGDFKGYPLQRNDLTNSLPVDRSKETFTYEEF